MIRHLVRRSAMVIALPAFVAGVSAAPAFAGGYGYPDDEKEVHVKVCKVVKDDDKDDDKGKGEYKKAKFHLKLWTDKDYQNVKNIKADKCKEYNLEYKDKKKVYVKEYDTPKGYEVDKVKCYSAYGYKEAEKKNGYYSCDFKKDWVKIVVVNEKDDDKKY